MNKFMLSALLIILPAAISFGQCLSNPQSVLFVGNSYTYYNGGVDSSLVQIYRSHGNSNFYTTMSQRTGSMTMQSHFNSPPTINAIKNGYNGRPWGVVVLQGQSSEPATNRATFLLYAQKLDSVIKAAGSKTCFELTWVWEWEDTVLFNQVVVGYDSASKRCGNAPICPVGYGFMNQRTSMQMYWPSLTDGHQNNNGTYLIALTFYAYFTGQTAIGTTFLQDSVSSASALILQNTAQAAVNAHPCAGATLIMEKWPGSSGSNRVSYGMVDLGRNIFRLTASAGGQYSIMTLSGAILKKNASFTAPELIDLSGFRKGVYIFSVSSISGSLAGKIMVK